MEVSNAMIRRDCELVKLRRNITPRAEKKKVQRGTRWFRQQPQNADFRAVHLFPAYVLRLQPRAGGDHAVARAVDAIPGAKTSLSYLEFKTG